MKSVRLAQIFRPNKEANRTHSQSYVEDLPTQCGQKRCVKMARLNLLVLPKKRDYNRSDCVTRCVFMGKRMKNKVYLFPDRFPSS